MKKALLTLPVLTLTSTSVFAANAGDGSVRSTGKIVNAAYAISLDTRKQEVVLGQVDKSMLITTGDKSATTPFKIELKNCDISTFRNMKVSFNGVDDVDNSKLISVNTEPSVVTGVGIGIYDNTNTPVGLNTGRSAAVLKEGQTILYFTANYVATKNTVTIGYDDAEIDSSLTYN